MTASNLSMPQPDPATRFIETVAASLQDGTFVRLVLSSPEGGDDVPRKVLGRSVMLKGRPHLSLTLRHPTQDVTRNIPVGGCAEWLRGQLGRPFRSALLGTTRLDWQFITGDSGVARLISHQPTTRQTPSREHDRKTAGLLDASARDWLRGLGLLDDAGKVRASMAGKYRQINRYLEILSHLAQDCGWIRENLQPSTFNTERPTGGMEDTDQSLDVERSKLSLERSPIQIADMGCGKGYLTFGAWHLFRRLWQRPVRVIGVEARRELVATTNKLARQIKADGLEFVAGTIESAKLPFVDALIALHACDTATDDAIRRGIELGAKLLIVAPCCHKEVRPQLGAPEPLAAVLRHGLMAERLAEWSTDGLRALFLEWAGYRTKMIEFVGSEHTPKNLMIAAVREREPFSDAAARGRIEALKEFLGIQQHALDALLQKP